MKPTKKIQIICLGDGKVGKTSILRRYKDGTFTTHHLTTIGVDYINVDLTINNEQVSVKIWDTAGQERFRTITHTFYKQSQGVLLVYDITDKESFESISGWVNSIYEHADTTVVKYLLGNKCDMADERKVTYEEGSKVAAQNEMKFFETSAKEDKNIRESIESIAKDVIEKMIKPEGNSNPLVLDGKKEKENSGCCGGKK
jgi:small GTP-binding protein